LQPLVRTEELFARIGGEEFAVLCPETDIERAGILAEKLRRLAGGTPFDAGGVLVPITVSIGVAVALPGMSRLEDLLRAADRALYTAKNEGRDRVRAWSGAEPG
jgi:diguanylate cyclase (GGDEF)-like protein